jgi:hypothetical protein
MYFWREFFLWEDNSHNRLIYHLAQIAAEIRRSGGAKNVRTEDFIAKFTRAETPKAAVKPDGTPDADIIASRTLNSQNYWKVLAGFQGGKKRPIPNKVAAATEARKAKARKNK